MASKVATVTSSREWSLKLPTASHANTKVGTHTCLTGGEVRRKLVEEELLLLKEEKLLEVRLEVEWSSGGRS